MKNLFALIFLFLKQDKKQQNATEYLQIYDSVYETPLLDQPSKSVVNSVNII